MKVKYTTATGRLTFEFESDTDKKLVANLAHIQEVFEEPACGCCMSDRIRFDVREFDGNMYYKLLCDACGATLDFGQHRSGDSLFVKRHEKDSREPLPNRGWYVYAEKAKPAPSAPPAKATPPAKPSPAPSTNQTTRTPEPPTSDVTASPKPTGPTAAASNGSGRAPVATTEDVAKAIDAMNHASTLHNFAEWVRWAKAIPGTDEKQRTALEQARLRNKARLERVPASM